MAASKQQKYRIVVEGKTSSIIPGVVCKFFACSYQSEQFFYLHGSSLRVSCQHWLSCCAFLFSKCFPDGCADFIWLSSNPSLTCWCTYVALFCLLAWRWHFWALFTSVSTVLIYIRCILWNWDLSETFLLFFLFLKSFFYLVMTWLGKVIPFDIPLIAVWVQYLWMANIVQIYWELAVRIVHSLWSHSRNAEWQLGFSFAFLLSTFQICLGGDDHKTIGITLIRLMLILVMVFVCCSCRVQGVKIQIFKGSLEPGFTGFTGSL